MGIVPSFIVLCCLAAIVMNIASRSTAHSDAKAEVEAKPVPIEPMQDADMPPVMLDASVPEDDDVNYPSGFEEVATSLGFRWFRPNLAHLHQELDAGPVPVYYATTSATRFARCFDRLLAFTGIPHGFGPQGRVLQFAGMGHRAPPVQAVRCRKRALRAIQVLRRQ